jgi:hypothetical protein
MTADTEVRLAEQPQRRRITSSSMVLAAVPVLAVLVSAMFGSGGA